MGAVRVDCRLTPTKQRQIRRQYCHVTNKDEVRVRCARERLEQRASHETAPTPQIYREEILALAQHPGEAARMAAYESVSDFPGHNWIGHEGAVMMELVTTGAVTTGAAAACNRSRFISDSFMPMVQ
jgi:hypothetical protein